MAILLSHVEQTFNLTATFVGAVVSGRPVGEPVFAAYRTPAGRWSIVAPGCWGLSGRTGVHRIAALDEPAAGGAKVIWLKKCAKID